MDSPFSTVFFNLFYTHVIVIISKNASSFNKINPVLCFSFGPSQDSALTFPNIIYIIASGDYILLIRFFFFHFYISVLPDQLKLLEVEGLSIAGTSDIMVTIEIKI